MTIRLDVSDITVVVTCTRCPWWSAIRFGGYEQGHECAAAHERLLHEQETEQARKAYRRWRARHAAKTGESG